MGASVAFIMAFIVSVNVDFSAIGANNVNMISVNRYGIYIPMPF